jgi:hypothetical protein
MGGPDFPDGFLDIAILRSTSPTSSIMNGPVMPAATAVPSLSIAILAQGNGPMKQSQIGCGATAVAFT